jgi:hypothetical protein
LVHHKNEIGFRKKRKYPVSKSVYDKAEKKTTRGKLGSPTNFKYGGGTATNSLY